MKVIVLGVQKAEHKNIQALADSVDLVFYNSTAELFAEYQSRRLSVDRIVIHSKAFSSVKKRLVLKDVEDIYNTLKNFLEEHVDESVEVVLLTTQVKLAQLFKYVFLSEKYVAIAESSISLIRLKEASTLEIYELARRYSKQFEVEVEVEQLDDIATVMGGAGIGVESLPETEIEDKVLPQSKKIVDKAFNKLGRRRRNKHENTMEEDSTDDSDILPMVRLGMDLASIDIEDTSDDTLSLDKTVVANSIPESYNEEVGEDEVELSTKFDDVTDDLFEVDVLSHSGVHVDTSVTQGISTGDDLEVPDISLLNMGDVLSEIDIDAKEHHDMEVTDFDTSAQKAYVDATKEVRVEEVVKEIEVVKEVIVKGKRKSFKETLQSLQTTKYIVVTGDRAVGKSSIAWGLLDVFAKHVNTLYVDFDLLNHGVIHFIGLDEYLRFSEAQQKGIEIVDIKTVKDFDNYVIKVGRNKEVLTGEWADIQVLDRKELLKRNSDLYENVLDLLGVLKQYKVVVIDIPLDELDYLSNLLFDAEICIVMRQTPHCLYNTLASVSRFEERIPVKLKNRIQPRLHYVLNECKTSSVKDFMLSFTTILDTAEIDWGEVPIVGQIGQSVDSGVLLEIATKLFG